MEVINLRYVVSIYRNFTMKPLYKERMLIKMFEKKKPKLSLHTI
jgi:hypothetical protein